MYKQKNEFLKPQQPCPICGGQDFEWGQMGGQAYYVPGDKFWRSRGQQAIRVRRCLQCNNLVQFTDEEFTRRQNRTTLVVIAIVVGSILVALCLPLILTSLSMMR